MINRIKTFIKGRRITENDGKYIPQLRVRDGLWFKWYGIQQITYSTHNEYRQVYMWNAQREQCAVTTINRAAINIYNYLESQREVKRLANIAIRKIVHDVEPEDWVKLKDTQ
jgi:hypothetical protein